MRKRPRQRDVNEWYRGKSKKVIDSTLTFLNIHDSLTNCHHSIDLSLIPSSVIVNLI